MAALDQAVAAKAGEELQAPGRGTLLFCSSPRRRVSFGSPDAERTLFTGVLLEVLREGIPGRQSLLSFADLSEAAYRRMQGHGGLAVPRPALHQPDQEYGDLRALPAFPNPAAPISANRLSGCGATSEDDAGCRPSCW